MMKPLFQPGIYNALLDYSLQDILVRHSELRAVLSKIEVEEQPARYAVFVARILKQALRGEVDPGKRLSTCNRMIDILAEEGDSNHLASSIGPGCMPKPIILNGCPVFPPSISDQQICPMQQ